MTQLSFLTLFSYLQLVLVITGSQTVDSTIGKVCQSVNIVEISLFHFGLNDFLFYLLEFRRTK